MVVAWVDSILCTSRRRGNVPSRPTSILAMTIDPKTGGLSIGEAHFASDLTEHDFLGSDVGLLATLIKSTTDQHWYGIWLPDPSGREVGITLGFAPSEKLRQIRLKMVKSETRRRGVWSGLAEDEMKVYHDKLLREFFREPPYNFPWGRTTSVIDQHDYSAVIIVNYGR